MLESEILTHNPQNIDLWKQSISSVCELAKSIVWLREECGQMLCSAVRKLASKESADEFVCPCLSQLKDHGLVKTPEGVALWLTVQSTFSNFENYPSGQWAHDHPLHRENKHHLIAAMKEHSLEAAPETNGEKLKTGFWQQSVHFSWSLVLARSIALHEEPNQASDIHHFNNVWSDLVDYSLLSEKSSVERKSWGLQLFSEFVISAPPSIVPTLFSRNVVHCVIEHRGNEQKLLHRSVTEALKKMKTRAVSDPTLATDMIIGLMGKGKNIFFDKLTKSKTMQDLFALADPDGLVQLTKIFDSLIIDQSGKELNTANSARQICSDLLLGAIRGRQKAFFEDEASSKCVGKVLELFLRHAYLVPKDVNSSIAPKPELSNDSRTMFHSRLSSCLNHILSLKPSNPSRWPWFAVHKIHSHTKASKPYQLSLEAEKSILKSLKQYYKTAESIESLASGRHNSEEAFALFFELSLLQSYSGDAEAIALLEEIQSCYIAIKSDHAPAATFDQLVEVFLTLLSKPSTLFKATVEHVFVAIAGGISAEGILSLTDILQKPESLAGRDELFDQVSYGEDEDEDSDVEVVDASDRSSEDGGDKSSVVSNDASDEELARFEESLAAALKTSKPSAEEDSGSDDEPMDDDQMEALEPHLAKIFHERQLLKNRSKEKKEAREVVINLKRRVLDLVSIYVKQQYSNPLCLNTILPLLRLLRTTHEKSLETKTSEALKLLYATCTKNKSLPSPTDTEDAWSIVETIHEEVRKDGSKVHGAACSRASLFVLKCLVGNDAAAYSRAVEVYASTQRAWFADQSVVVQPTFFTEWISWSVEMRRQRGSSSKATPAAAAGAAAPAAPVA